MFYYAAYVYIADRAPCYLSAVYSISSQEQAPLAKMIGVFRRWADAPQAQMLCSRVITPDDYQELLKMGVQNFKLDFKPQLVQNQE